MNEKRASIAARLAGRWPTILAAIGLGLLVAWLLPRRSREVVLVDGSGRWPAAASPLQRTIAWRPAEPLPAGPEDLAAADSLVRPQFAEGGRAIYFTRQRPGHDADIYRAEFDGDRWLPAEPVEAINSGRGDYGPFISPDGRTLLLYSERDGGFGGYDIYVSRREDRD
ncbi:MAG: TolB family protein, partial [Planctomycetia bacterium]